MQKFKNILRDIEYVLSEIDVKQQEKLISSILQTNRIFLAGVGRSGLMVKAFAMRLMHLGLNVYIVSEVLTPAIRENDLLIIVSGSGETSSLISVVKFARKLGAIINFITASESSSIAEYADTTLYIKAKTKIITNKQATEIQPMATLFEETIMILFDFIVLEIMNTLSISEEEMFEMHANLE